jgi:glutamine amidotransferase
LAVIALIDYGAGNLRSVHKALLHLGVEVRLVRQAEELDGCPGIVLPGVGAFDDCSLALKKQALMEATRQRLKDGAWFLGICVGYQILFERSDEFESTSPGFGWFKGPVVRFPDQPGLKVPQIGWNQVQQTREDCPLFRGIPDNSHFYFVHSYHPQPADPSITAGQTEYGGTFTSAVWKDRVFATQFHPEKSQTLGLKLLQNFVELV